MPQDAVERVQVFLSKTEADPFALLLDLTKLLPESLLQRAIYLAKHTSKDVLRAFLIHELAKRLPTKKERIELTRTCPLPEGIDIKEYSVPEGKQAKRLLAKLSEEQRYEIFDRFFIALEPGHGTTGEGSRIGFRREERSRIGFRRKEGSRIGFRRQEGPRIGFSGEE